ncbi:MAG: tripartite tricarboxylate transporter substrate binding protein [Betaproteobacteria bacterium]
MPMKMPYKLFAACCLFFSAITVSAQPYPNHVVRIILPYPPGGSMDALGRMVFDRVSQALGQQFVIDYRPGASGNIGSEIAARSAPDGHTLLLNTLPFVVNPSLYKKMPFDTTKDFAPISLLATSPFVLVVHPSVPAKTVAEFIALAKKQSGKLNYSSAGIGTNLHVAAELFKNLTKTEILHVPYKGGGAALIATVGGEADLSFIGIQPAFPHIQSNKLRALGITTVKRAPSLPDLPSISETVPGYEFSSWWGLLAPAATPPAIVQLLSEQIAKAARAPEIAKRFEQDGVDAVAGTPAQFAASIKSDIARWAKVIKDNRIEPQ